MLSEDRHRRHHPQEIDELFKIFRVLGTPTEATWPGISQLPDYKDIFPHWPRRNLAELVPTLEPAGVDVLAQMLQCGALCILSSRRVS